MTILPYDCCACTAGPEWVTRALRTSQRIAADNACTSLEVRPLGSSGLLGEMVLVTWAFAQPVPFAAEVVAKFTPASKKLQAISLTLGLFSCEFHYYRYLSARSAVRCPQLIYGDFHYRSHRFMLILEKVDGTCAPTNPPATQRAAALFHR